MPDFEARFTSGVAVATWTDAGVFNVASTRINPNSQGAPHYYFQTRVGALVTLKVTPNGLAEGAADALLGGRLFSYLWTESPSGAGPALIVAPGFSTILQFVPTLKGGYLLGARRPGGGAAYIHLRCE